MITPQTDVILLKVPLEMDNNNQLTFENKEAQFNYFYNLPKLEVSDTDFTYQRKDSVIRVPALIDDIMMFNYVMYRNNAYSDKWFYAFIDDMEYGNDSVTIVKIRTDTWQTWQFDLNYKPVFVEREHTNDDTIGANTVPEGVETGEFVVNGDVIQVTPIGGATPYNQYIITFMVSDTTPMIDITFSAQQYNGIFSGYTLFGVDTYTGANDIVRAYSNTTGTEGSMAEAIKNIFLVPAPLYGVINKKVTDRFPYGIYIPENTTRPIDINNMYVPRLSTLDGYTPKNNKMYTYPYSAIFLTNSVSGNAVYRYEDFANADPQFTYSGVLTSGCDIKIAPTHYKNVEGKNEAYGLKMGKLPVCSWNTDSYAIWLAQNELNMRVSLTRNTLKSFAGVVSKNPEMALEGVSGYAGDLLNSLSERYLAEHVPDEVHGDPNSSDYNFSAQLFFEFRRMSVRREFATRIDNYFSAVGYATNQVKLPNITGRRNWNYVKTVDCYIEADIPQRDLQEIKTMFNRGITFWHNPATFADYSQNNDII